MKKQFKSRLYLGIHRAEIISSAPVAQPLDISLGGDQIDEVRHLGVFEELHSGDPYDLYEIHTVWAGQISDPSDPDEMESNSEYSYVAVAIEQ